MRRAASLLAAFVAAVAVIEGGSIALSQTAGPAAPSTSPASPTSSATAPPPVEIAAPPIGASYDDDASLPQHATEVASYTMHATLDSAEHVVRGEGTIAWTNTSRTPQRELWVHLYMNAFKSDETLFMRSPRSGFRGHRLGERGSIDVQRFAVAGMGDLWPARSKTTEGDPEDETDIRVPLTRAVAPGESLTIDMAWTTKLPSISLRTGHEGSFHMVAQWFPKLARLESDGTWAHFPFHPFSEFYADFGAYDVTVDTPSAFIVGATGALSGETRAGDRTVRRFRQSDVHDFAFTAWDGFEESDAEQDGVAIRCLYPRGYANAAKAEIDAARFGLRHFGAAYGRYPYATLTLVHPPEVADEAGGMEYPTLITTGGPWWIAGTGVRWLDILTIHELGHQWFYGLVATDEHAFPFLDEGVNSYAETEAMETKDPSSSVAGVLGIQVGLPAVHRMEAIGVEKHAPVAQAASAFLVGSDYGRLVYSRTATILNTLGRVYGEDLVRRAIGRYARRYRFAHPGPPELLGAIDEVVGHDAAIAAREALFHEGSVDYAVEEIVDRVVPASSPGAPPEHEGYALVRRFGTLRFPIEIALRAEDGSITRATWDGVDLVTKIPYRGLTALASAEIDPEHRVLLEDRLDDNVRASSRSILPRVLERATFAAECLLTGITP